MTNPSAHATLGAMFTLYLACKALHLISMVAWFAGLFYLPRLFVYHVEKPESAATLTIMEGKLMRYIMRPAALGTWVGGIGMIIITPELLHMGWLHAKLGLVLLLITYHGSLEGFTAAFRAGRNTRSGRFFRMYTEVPSLLLIATILLAVFKPF